MLVMWFAAIASAIVDNIPLVIAMLPLLRTMIPVFGQQLGLMDDPEALRLHSGRHRRKHLAEVVASIHFRAGRQLQGRAARA